MLQTYLARISFSLFLSLSMLAPALGAGRSYIVARGDTLSAIAQREHVSQSDIVRFNHLSDANFLREGQVLILAAPHVQARMERSNLFDRNSARQKTAKHARRMMSHRQRSNGRAVVAQQEALWIAMHTGFSAPDLTGIPSFAAAQRMMALELRLTRTALRYLGVPYMWGGESFSGVDCSGFVQAVFRRNGIELPRTADAQFEVGRHVTSVGLQPGDLVFFQTYAWGASHVGIYLGDGRFVHASASDGVRVDSLSDGYYSSRYIGARRAAI